MSLDFWGSPAPAFDAAGRARPFDDADAPFIIVSYRVQHAVVRTLAQFAALCPKATLDERALVEALLIDAPCVHVIPQS